MFSLPILHLSLIEHIGPAIIQKIITALSAQALNDIYVFHTSDFMMRCGISEKYAALIVAGLRDTSVLEKEIALLTKHKINVITILDETYPAQLKEIYLPPVLLYMRGNDLSFTEKSIAVIGSRLADAYGKRIIDALLPPLIAHDWAIISGGALGADTMAHQKTIECGGKTAVILGSGLLRPYPAKNRKLFDAVVETGGALISAFPLLMDPFPGHFPARNRIIAGLSKGCIVVQAAQKSGARITAEFALEQGRHVFAVPGHFDDPLSVGCHALIADGAQLITSAQDILQAYGEIASGNQPIIDDQLRQSLIASKKEEAPTIQHIIINACIKPCSIEELATHTGLSIHALQALLFELQLAGNIEQDFTGRWIVTL